MTHFTSTVNLVSNLVILLTIVIITNISINDIILM